MNEKSWVTKIRFQDPEVLECMQIQQQNLLLHVYLQPNASSNEIIGMHNGYLKIRIAAAALEGKANITLCEFLAREFAVPKVNVNIIKGVSCRHKTVQIKQLFV